MHTDKDIEYLNLPPVEQKAIQRVREYERVNRGEAYFGDKLTNGIVMTTADHVAVWGYRFFALVSIIGCTGLYIYLWTHFPEIAIAMHIGGFLFWVLYQREDMAERRKKRQAFEEQVIQEYNELTAEEKAKARAFWET